MEIDSLNKIKITSGQYHKKILRLRVMKQLILLAVVEVSELPNEHFFHLYHDKNKLHCNEMIMMSTLY